MSRIHPEYTSPPVKKKTKKTKTYTQGYSLGHYCNTDQNNRNDHIRVLVEEIVKYPYNMTQLQKKSEEALYVLIWGNLRDTLLNEKKQGTEQ